MACFDARANIEHLKQKQDAGASFFVTQLFFDNACFYRFRESAERAGVTAPITCGVMPLMSKAQVQRMVFMCGASLPAALVKLVAKYADAPTTCIGRASSMPARSWSTLRPMVRADCMSTP